MGSEHLVFNSQIQDEIKMEKMELDSEYGVFGFKEEPRPSPDQPGPFVETFIFFIQHNFCMEPYVPREPWIDPSNRRLYHLWTWDIYQITLLGLEISTFFVMCKHMPTPLGYHGK